MPKNTRSTPRQSVQRLALMRAPLGTVQGPYLRKKASPGALAQRIGVNLYVIKPAPLQGD